MSVWRKRRGSEASESVDQLLCVCAVRLARTIEAQAAAKSVDDNLCRVSLKRSSSSSMASRIMGCDAQQADCYSLGLRSLQGSLLF